jgi:cytochrome c-type biogenesis protein CcmH/NrfF
MIAAAASACLLFSLSAYATAATAFTTSRQAEKPTSSVSPTSQQAVAEAEADLEARTTAVASTLRCPVCQGESIQDSPAELAKQMRQIVKERLRAGETPEQVQAYFMGRYGEWILLQPRKTGLNLLLYAWPVVLVLGGLTLVAMLVKRWTTPDANQEHA